MFGLSYKSKFHGRLLKSREAAPIFQNDDPLQILKDQNLRKRFFFPAGENDV